MSYNISEMGNFILAAGWALNKPYLQALYSIFNCNKRPKNFLILTSHNKFQLM
jgi:hypothetical protein